MLVFFIKEWFVDLLWFFSFLIVAIKPSLITKYGKRSQFLDKVVRYISMFINYTCFNTS